MLFYTFLHFALCSRNNKYSVNHLFLLHSSLHKQPFITAQTAFHHCTFSLITAHFVHHCTLKQALLCWLYSPLVDMALLPGNELKRGPQLAEFIRGEVI